MLAKIAACRLVPKMLERHELFWSQFWANQSGNLNQLAPNVTGLYGYIKYIRNLTGTSIKRIEKNHRPVVLVSDFIKLFKAVRKDITILNKIVDTGVDDKE